MSRACTCGQALTPNELQPRDPWCPMHRASTVTPEQRRDEHDADGYSYGSIHADLDARPDQADYR